MYSLLLKQLASILRGLLKAVGGWLVGRAILSSEDADTFVDLLVQIVIGLAPLVVAQIWSWIEKTRTRQVIDVALELPSGSSTRDLEVALR